MTSVDWTRDFAGAFLAGLFAAGLAGSVRVGCGGVAPMKSTTILPPPAVPCGGVTGTWEDNIMSNRNSRCSNALVIQAIQCCQRSSQDPVLVSAGFDALLMPPELHRGWGTSCGIYSVQTAGAPS